MRKISIRNKSETKLSGMYNFRVNEKEQEMIRHINASEIDLPKMMREFIGEIYKELKDTDIDGKAYMLD